MADRDSDYEDWKVGDTLIDEDGELYTIREIDEHAMTVKWDGPYPPESGWGKSLFKRITNGR